MTVNLSCTTKKGESTRYQSSNVAYNEVVEYLHVCSIVLNEVIGGRNFEIISHKIMKIKISDQKI